MGRHWLNPGDFALLLCRQQLRHGLGKGKSQPSGSVRLALCRSRGPSVHTQCTAPLQAWVEPLLSQPSRRRQSLSRYPECLPSVWCGPPSQPVCQGVIPQESSLRPRMRPHLPEWTLRLSVHCKILTHSLGESLPRSAATASCMLSISRVQSGCLCPWRAPLSSLPGHHNMLHHQPPRTPQSGQLSQATSRGPCGPWE